MCAGPEHVNPLLIEVNVFVCIFYSKVSRSDPTPVSQFRTPGYCHWHGATLKSKRSRGKEEENRPIITRQGGKRRWRRITRRLGRRGIEQMQTSNVLEMNKSSEANRPTLLQITKANGQGILNSTAMVVFNIYMHANMLTYIRANIQAYVCTLPKTWIEYVYSIFLRTHVAYGLVG